MAHENGVAAVGEAMLELSAAGDGLWTLGHAGDTFNTLWALRALLPDAVAADFVTAFGDDPFSHEQIAFMRAAGIGTAASPTIAGARPGLYAITLEGWERSFTYWRGDSAARQLASDPVALTKSLENRALIYFSGITLAILDDASRKTLLEALAAAREAGARIAFDPNYRPRLWASPEAARAAVAEALRVTDIALPTLSDERDLFGDETASDAAGRLHAAGVAEVVVKNGPEDAFSSAGGEARHVAALLVADALDSTGAGDAFNGGYLAARLLGDAPEAATARAHRVAAATVRVRGALAPFDRLREAFG